jgi:hypothetical protein
MTEPRTLQDGSYAPAYDVAVELSVYTKCPSKWKLVDMETGEEYIGQLPTINGDYHWKRNAPHANKS